MSDEGTTHKHPMFTGPFWLAAAERGIKSTAYAALSMLLVTGTALLNTDWVAILSVAGMAGVLSVLGSIASNAVTGGTGPSLSNAEALTPPAIPVPPDATTE